MLINATGKLTLLESSVLRDGTICLKLKQNIVPAENLVKNNDAISINIDADSTEGSLKNCVIVGASRAHATDGKRLDRARRAGGKKVSA